MGALCHQPFGLGRQPSGCCVRLLVLGTTRFHCVSRIGEADTEKAFVTFLASLGWRPSAAPTHDLDALLDEHLQDAIAHEHAARAEAHAIVFPEHEPLLG